MQKTTSRKIILAGMVLSAILVAVVLVALLQRTPLGTPLQSALEGGEYSFAAVGRAEESFGEFSHDDETRADEVLEAARSSLDQAEVRLDYAKRSGDEYVGSMAETYGEIADSGSTMISADSNLLAVGDEIRGAIASYGEGDYASAAQKAGQALQVLEPLLPTLNETQHELDNLSYQTIASGHRGQARVSTERFENVKEGYEQYVNLLRSLLYGEQYLQDTQLLEDLFQQLQSALANGDMQSANQLIEQINQLLQQFQGSQYQDAAQHASQLNPDMLEGEARQVAQELSERLRSSPDVGGMQSHMRALQRYADALQRMQQGDMSGAQDAINQGMDIINQQMGQGTGQGPGTGGQQLQRLLQGLAEAFSSLQMSMGEPPPPD